MALTELQLPSKTEFYRSLQNAASEMDALMLRWASMAEYLSRIETADLDSMGVAVGAVRTDLVDFRIAVNELVQLYNGTATTPTKNPSTVIDKIRRMG